MDAGEWAELESFLATDESDYAALTAALAWVDDSALPSLPQPPGNSLSTSPPASSTDTSVVSEDGDEPARESPVKSRKRRHNRRDEIQLLKATARQLEARLAFLKERATNGAVASAAKVDDSTDKTNQLWKRVAVSQLTALSESERENTRLRAMVEDQLRLIKGLERLVMKKRSKTFSWCPENSNHSSGIDPVEDPEVERDMYASIEDMLSDVDRILADERLQCDPEEPKDFIELTSDDHDHPVIESMHTRMFPFAYQAAANALWTMWTSARIHIMHSLRRKDIRVDGDTVRGVLEGEFMLHNVAARFRAKIIGRRVVQHGRIIMPAVVLIEPMIQVGGKPLSGVYLRLRICNIFRNVPGDGPVTSRVFYSTSTPMTFGDHEEQERLGIGALTNLVLQTSDVRVKMNNQILENHLLASFEKLGLNDKP
ncbi:hypothetical protein Poli38472_011838 [Pythium oligandrum]|uniref:Uncharacterized protein n=1 Tax=Pythium oligandrum TaxID=41045 RepID=A0A8K1C8J4_PYTOL|nr:hypothetical protein Poli38472_011838 [Pythium oligandrum]|eukprot:TMW58250.1 hypothetical protein Poli38472_011838 [Pythium oligandrum]